MWSQVECGYDSANETIVFGSRQIAEGDALYETSTLAVISNDGQIDKNPDVQCINRNGKVFLAIDNTFRVLSGNCTNLDLYATFECSINSFNISSDDEILILCLNDGNIHCLHVPSSGKLICSALINESLNNSAPFSIFSTNNEDSCSFIICTRKNIYRLKITNIPDVYYQINNEIDNLEVNFVFDNMDLNLNPILTSFKYENNLYYSSNLKHFSDCERFILALDDEGSIIGICKKTKLMYKLYNKDTFNNMMILKNINSDQHRLLVNSLSETESYIRLLSFPNFEIVYNLKVSANTYLVSIKNEQDEVMFIEGVCSKGSEFVNELRLKVISESNPDVKLKRLLRRKLFEEAKKFARTFRLDMQQVYIAEAEEYIIQNNFNISDIDEFCKILDNVKDVVFIVEQCLINTTADTLENIEKLLKYAFHKLENVLQNNPDDEMFLKYKTIIVNLFYKLDTFKILYRNEEFLNNEMLVNTWVQFSYVSFLDEMYNFLKQGKIDKCTILFNRIHEDTINEEKIKNILHQIPRGISLTTYLPFFRHLLLFSLHQQPSCLTIIINWIYNYSINHQNLKSNWLEYLQNFCNYINNFLYENNIQNLSFQKEFTENGCLVKFRNLLNTLNELSILKRDFEIQLSVGDYMQEPNIVVQILLDEIPSDKLKEFLKKFINKFCSQHKMSVDEVLFDYIKFVSGSRKSFWDETAVCLIPFISSNTLRMETIVGVLESAEVPWSNAVDNLAKQGAEECHPLASKIKNHIKNIPWKLLLKKYAIPDMPRYETVEEETDDAILISRRILKLAKPEMLEDLNTIMEIYPNLKNRLQILCFNNFVQKGQMENALKYLNNLKPEIIINCFDSAMLFVQNFMFSNLPINNIVNNFLDILRSLLLHSENHISEYEYEIYYKNMRKLKNIFILKEKYDCNEIESIDFNLSTLLPKIITNIISKNSENWFEIVKECEKISELLEISKETSFFELGNQASNLKSLIYSAENILKSESTAENMCTMAEMLMKNLNNQQIENCNFSMMQNGDFSNESVTTALSLINKLALKACVVAENDCLQKAAEILNWSKGCYWIKIPKKYDFQIFSLYQPENICSLSFSSTLVIKDYFSLLLLISENRNIFVHENENNSILEEQLLTKIESLPEKMKQLHIEGYDLTAYQLLNIIKIELMSLNRSPEFHVKAITKINHILNNRFVPQLLNKIFVSKKIDNHLAFSLFLSSDFEPLKWMPTALKKYKMNVKKLHAAASLACKYMELKNIPNAMYLNLKYRCEWWQKFLHNCVSYNDTFQLNPDEIVSSYLIKSEKFTLKTLKDFCHDFNLNMQKFLPLYLKNILTQWKPKIEEGVVSGDEKLFEKCQEIISNMENTITAVEHLNAAWIEISYYKHEVYICILNLFLTLEEKCGNPEKGVLLMFLKDYRRIKKPTQKEIDDWQTKYPFAREIDPLSEFRLPFFLEMCTNDYWEIIRPEINLMTYEKWFKNAPHLNLDRDHICMFAIKGTVESGVFNSKDPTWSTNTTHDSLLNNMKMCARQITDLKKATAVLYQAVKKISGGADQVAIARMCRKKALQWKKSTPRASENENDINMKCTEVTKKYLNCLTMHILHTYNVGTEKYLNLIENTELLIKELYQDDSIIARTKGAVMFCPDINKIVDELGEQLEKDLIQIRTSLVMEFLQKSCKIINFDESYSFAPEKSADDDTDIFCENLKRVIYICESKDYETIYDLLCNISFANLDETVSKFATTPDLNMRVKALQCLIVVTKNIDELEELIGEKSSSYLEKLQILLSLETLGYSLSVYELDKCNQVDLVTKILRQKSTNISVIKSLAKLCSIYNLWDSNLWNKILERFIDLRMFSDLQEWLPKLFTICYCPNLNSPFVNGWISLIKNSFLKSLDDKQYYQGLLYIQLCPIVTMLDETFLEIFHLYSDQNIFEICAMFLPYVQKDTQIKMVDCLKVHINEKIYRKIENLSLLGILNTDTTIKILKSSI